MPLKYFGCGDVILVAGDWILDEFRVSLQALLWTFGIRRRNGKRPGNEGALLSPTNRDTKTKHSVSAEAFEM